MADSGLIQRIVETLNALLALDPKAIQALVNTRVPCNAALTDHPTCQVGWHDHQWCVGMLGVINTLFELSEGAVVAVYDDKTGTLLRFGILSQPNP